MYILYFHISPSNKVYVGITSAKDPQKRWGPNGIGYIKNKHLYSAIKRYGWDNFTHEIRLTGLTKEEAYNRERYYISLFRSDDPKYGYNKTKGGEGCDKGKNSYDPATQKALHKAYQETHKSEIREKHRQYINTHREEYNTYQNNYYHTHIDKCKSHRKKYAQSDKGKETHYKSNHSELNKLRQKKYYEAHKEEIALKRKLKRDANR